MLSDAKNEIIQQISSRCGFEVAEQKLSPSLRDSITSAAEIMKQLSVIRNLLLVEKKDSERLVSRMKRKISGREDKDIQQYLQQLSELHKTLDQRIDMLADQIYQELQREWGETKQEERAGLSIEQLKCQNCGAPLKVPSSLITKCEYCGAVYQLSEYLDMMGKNLSLATKEEKKEDSQPSNQESKDNSVF